MTHESFMSRDIDDANKEIVIQMPVGKSEFRCDASFLLFLETIAIDTRERPDQGRLTMIDMTCGAYDYTFHDRLRLYHEWARRERVEERKDGSRVQGKDREGGSAAKGIHTPAEGAGALFVLYS